MLTRLKKLLKAQKNISNDSGVSPNTFRENIRSKKIHTLAKWLSQSESRNGYLREEALREIAESHDDEVLDVLLQRQNDYVPQVRDIAFNALMKRIVFQHLERLLPSAHHILHLQNHSRSNYQAIHKKFIELLVQPHSIGFVRSYIEKHQGKAVRAIYDFLVTSKKISEDELLEISMSSPDIGVNQKRWDFINALPIQKRLSLLRIENTKSAFKNRQFHFKLLFHLILNEDFSVWEGSVLDFLPISTPAQSEALYFYLKQKGISFEYVTESLVHDLGEQEASKKLLKIIAQLGDGAELKRLLKKFPTWQQSHAEEVLSLSTLLMPEDELTRHLNKASPDIRLSQPIKERFFKRWRVGGINEYKNYARILKLTEEESLFFSQHLPTWEHLFFLIEYIEDHPKMINQGALNEACQQLAIKFKSKPLYAQSVNKQRQEKLKAFLADTENSKYFVLIRYELMQLKLL